MARKLCFRFDVDTHKCAKVGIPNLLQLAEQKGVKFTFFVNCGRAISRRESLKALFTRQRPGANAAQLSSRHKFGTKEYLVCALQNPKIIKYDSIIKLAHQQGHEIGLHGGRNHEIWCRNVDRWSEEQIREEIKWGLRQLENIAIHAKIFASPCAKGGDRVRWITGDMGFKYISDDLNSHNLKPKNFDKGIIDIPTAICGEGGVAYLEHHVALGRTAREIVADFGSRLNQSPATVFYDHPYFAGDQGIDLLAGLIDFAQSRKVEICHLSEIGAFYEKDHFSRSRP